MSYPKTWEPLFTSPKKCPTHGLSMVNDTCMLCEIEASGAPLPKVVIAEKTTTSGLPAGLTLHQWNTWTPGQIRYYMQAATINKNRTSSGTTPSAVSPRQRGRPRTTAKINRSCVACQQDFQIYSSQPKKFCSRACYAKWREI